MASGKIYLVPNFLGESPIDYNFPPENVRLLSAIKHFIVEDVRTARRFLKKVDKSINIDVLTFYVLDKHTRAEDIPTFLAPAAAGSDMGIISEAGCPGVADPGSDVVAIAHRKGIRVVPLIGPSSILMAMMASGMNGQNFAFVGYLPLDKGGAGAAKAIRHLEERSAREGQTQIFIETPFRNVKMFDDLTHTLRPTTRLCIACDVTCEGEYIVTRSVSEWRKAGCPDIQKRPTIFLIHA